MMTAMRRWWKPHQSISMGSKRSPSGVGVQRLRKSKTGNLWVRLEVSERVRPDLVSGAGELQPPNSGPFGAEVLSSPIGGCCRATVWVQSTWGGRKMIP